MKGITLAQVDGRGKPIPGTEEYYSCDTLLLSVGLIPENELSKEAGVELSPVTSGPVVNESLETSIPGVFACGNVLHVHDLVDFVSEEAAAAGKNAATYILGNRNGTAEAVPEAGCDGAGASQQPDGKGGLDAGEKAVPIVPTAGVRYTVPAHIRVNEMEEQLKVRFRVGAVYSKCYVSVYLDGERIIHKRRPVMAPGEMEEVLLKKTQLQEHEGLAQITVKIEEA